MNDAAPSPPLRRSEIIAAISLATDLAIGQPVEYALKSCVLAMRLARMRGADAATLAQVYHQALLRYIGCNAETHAMAALFGDEIAFRRDFALIDQGRAAEIGALIFAYLKRAHADVGALQMISGVFQGLAASKSVAREGLSSHCEVAQRLAERLGFPAAVRRNLGQIYERWDGRGLPNGLKGEAIAPAVALVSFAQDVIALIDAFGLEVAKAKVLERSGGAYQPGLAEGFAADAAALTAGVEATTWEDVLALEPEPHAILDEAAFDEACLAMADFADLKSPFSVGHSRAVASLAAEAARRCGLPDADATDLERAGLLHDIGQVAVPARIWMKAGPLSDSEWAQARLHSYFGERVLARPAALARLGALVGQHHEQLDGSGYHRGARGTSLSLQSRILAAAESYRNKIERRPHRAAFSVAAAAEALKREAREGKLDADAVSAVLAAGGHATPARRESLAGLTPRELDVLRAIARGQSTKEIARFLGLSPKTVDNHTQSVFAKIDVKTRGGATLFAIERGLCGPA